MLGHMSFVAAWYRGGFIRKPYKCGDTRHHDEIQVGYVLKTEIGWTGVGTEQYLGVILDSNMSWKEGI